MTRLNRYLWTLLSILLPLAFVGAGVLISEAGDCQIGFKSMRSCNVLGFDVSLIIWCLYYGGSFLIWPGIFIAIVGVTYLILGDLSEYLKHKNGWSLTGRSNRQAKKPPAIER